MMKISNNAFTIRLPKSSRASVFTDIKQILNVIPYKTDEKFILIEFQEKREELKQLVELGKSLSAFKLYINGNPVNKSDLLYITRWALFCPYSGRCEGICMVDLRSFGFRSLQDIHRSLDPENPFENRGGDYQNLIESNYSWIQYIEKEEEDQLEIDHNKLVEEIRRDLQIQEKYCDIFDWKAIEKKLRQFPSTFEVKPKINNWDLLFYYLEEVLPEKITANMEKTLRQLAEEAGLIKPEKSIEKNKEENIDR